MLKGLWVSIRYPNYEFDFKHFPSRTVIFIILANGGGFTPTPLIYNTKDPTC